MCFIVTTDVSPPGISIVDPKKRPSDLTMPYHEPSSPDALASSLARSASARRRPLLAIPRDWAKGAVLVVSAELTFVLMGAAIRMVAQELPNAEIVFFRNLIGVSILLPLC